MSLDDAAARAALCRWQDVLRLRDWDIRIEIASASWRKSGDIKVDAANKLAVLLLNRTVGAEAEEIVLHELLHLKLHGLDRMMEDLLAAVYGSDDDDPRRQFAYAQFMDLLETTTQDLTKALFAAGGRETESVSKLLRDSIAGELGDTQRDECAR